MAINLPINGTLAEQSEGVGDMPRLNIFICGEGLGNRDHIGYTYNGIEVYRNLNETTDEIMKHPKG